jgi:hypothetical protein
LRRLHRLFRPPGRGDVHHRPHKRQHACFIPDRMHHDMERFHRAVGQQQPVLDIPIAAVAGCALDEPLHAFAVFRMRSLNDGFDGGCSRPIQLENPERFVRPDETAGGAPAEAAGVTEPLGFRQIGLFGRDLGGGFLAVASEGQDDQKNGEKNAAGHGRGRQHELPDGILVDPRAQPRQLGVVRLCQEIYFAVERFPVGPVGVVVPPRARSPLADLIAEPDQLRAEPDELLRPRLRPCKIVAIVRRHILLPGRHGGVELGQKFHDAGAVGGPVGGVRRHVDAARIHHHGIDESVRVLGKKRAVGNLFKLAHMLVGGVDGGDADHAHGQDDQAQRGNDGIHAAKDGKTAQLLPEHSTHSSNARARGRRGHTPGRGAGSASFLRTTPARKPRTECCCHPVAFIIAAMVVPFEEDSSAMTRDCLESGSVFLIFGSSVVLA